MALVLRVLRRDGTTFDVPAQQATGSLGFLESGGPVQALIWRGATADRPPLQPLVGWGNPGMFDTTLGEPIFLVNGSRPNRWVDINGSPV